MKQVKFFLLISIALAFIQPLSGQIENTELKVQIIEYLIKTDTYLIEASNVDYDNMCRIEFHNKAIKSYKKFDNAYAMLKPNLNNEIIEKFKGLINVYGQVAKDGSFQYLSDGATITALLISSARIEEILKLFVK